MRTIHVVTAVIRDDARRLLLVRKRGTSVFMQPGGKVEPGESARAALARELAEEVSLHVDPAAFRSRGRKRAAAVNEPDCIVEADMFALDWTGDKRPGCEIEEIW